MGIGWNRMRFIWMFLVHCVPCTIAMLIGVLMELKRIPNNLYSNLVDHDPNHSNIFHFNQHGSHGTGPRGRCHHGLCQFGYYLGVASVASLLGVSGCNSVIWPEQNEKTSPSQPTRKQPYRVKGVNGTNLSRWFSIKTLVGYVSVYLEGVFWKCCFPSRFFLFEIFLRPKKIVEGIDGPMVKGNGGQNYFSKLTMILLTNLWMITMVMLTHDSASEWKEK